MRILLLSLLVFAVSNVSAQNGTVGKKDFIKTANYDESKIPSYTLPDILTCIDGEKVTTAKQWEKKRRPELLTMVTDYMYGRAPKIKGMLPYRMGETESILHGTAIHQTVYMRLAQQSDAPEIAVQLYIPNSSKPVPAFLFMIFGDKPEDWQIAENMKAGIALVTFRYTAVTPDKKYLFETGIHPYYYKKGQTYPMPNEWGTVAAWSWTASRILDILEKDKRFNAKQVAVLGHSRLGKAALWAGASDERFAITIPINSGCCGAALSRRQIGETLECVNYNFPYWFCGNYLQFATRENQMPFDQHSVVALVAPRPIYIASASEDNWADPHGEFLGGFYASPAYELYGKKGLAIQTMPAIDVPSTGGNIAYHIRTGRHAVLPYDWQQFILFAKKYFK